MTCEYVRVLPRKDVIRGSRDPGCDREVTWGQRIDESVADVQTGKDDGC